MKNLDELNETVLEKILSFTEKTKYHILKVIIEPDNTTFEFMDNDGIRKKYVVSNERFKK